jgi:hypothetical protein
LTAPTAYQGPRTLLKEGPVTKSKSGRKLTMVLCNDIIVLVESRNLYRMVCSPQYLIFLLPPHYIDYSFTSFTYYLHHRVMTCPVRLEAKGQARGYGWSWKRCHHASSLGDQLIYSLSHYMKYKLEKVKMELFN